MSHPAPVIVVGVDGTAGSHDALALAGRLAAPLSARVVAVNVYSPCRTREGRTDPFATRRSRRESETLLERIGQAHPLPALEGRPVAGACTARELARTARSAGAAMIVVGASRSAREGSPRVGATGMLLLRDSGLPVAIAPRGLARGQGAAADLRRIDVGYAGSERAGRALATAHELATATCARLIVQRVHEGGWERLAGTLGDAGDAGRAALAESRARLSHGLAVLGIQGLVSGRFTVGDALRVLADASEDTDLLVIGAAADGTRTVAEGSLALALARRASCALLVVPEDDALRRIETPHFVATLGSEPAPALERADPVAG